MVGVLEGDEEDVVPAAAAAPAAAVLRFAPLPLPPAVLLPISDDGESGGGVEAAVAAAVPARLSRGSDPFAAPAVPRRRRPAAAAGLSALAAPRDSTAAAAANFAAAAVDAALRLGTLPPLPRLSSSTAPETQTVATMSSMAMPELPAPA